MRCIRFFLTSFVFFFIISVSGAQVPQYGGTLVISNHADVTGLNPVWQYSYAGYGISTNIYSTLVVSDMGVTVGQKAYGNLAKSWEVSSDGLTYKFHLYDNVYWHDGVKFSSDDVKFTYETAIKKSFPIGKYLDIVKEILTPDKNTIIFKLTRADAAFLTMLAQASNWYGQIIAKHLYEGTDIVTNPYNKKPIGTGPFKFEEWQPGQFVSLIANEKYFRGRPYLDKIIYRLYSNKEVAQADFKSGKIDHLTYMQMPTASEIKALAAQPGVKLWKQKSIYGHDIMLNHTRKPCNEVRVREAIALAIDREQICQLAWAGLVVSNYHGSAIGTPDFTNKNAVWPQQDLNRARQLLDEAGYPVGSEGTRLKLTIVSTEYYKDMNEVIVQQLRQIGIQAKIDLVDAATWEKRLNSADFDLNPYWYRFGPDPDAYREHFGLKGARNFGRYSNATVDQLLEEGRKTFTQSKRKEIYDKVQELLRKDVAYVPVAEYGYFEFSKSKLHGTPMGDPASYGKSCGWAGLQAIWFEK